MNVKQKRHIASWVLLAVFVPMLIMSSLHIHNPATDYTEDCNECVQHHCHGHLAQTEHGVHHCLLCQFLTVSFVAATTVVVALFAKSITLYALPQSNVCIVTLGTPTLRGPPLFVHCA